MDIYTKLVPYLSESSTTTPPSTSAPPDLTKNAFSLRTGVVLDNVPIGSSFGKVLTQPNASYSRGSQVKVKFQGANPRVSTIKTVWQTRNSRNLQNNNHLEGTFLTIERQVSSTWVTYRTDSHPSTKYHWLRTNGVRRFFSFTFVRPFTSMAVPWF